MHEPAVGNSRLGWTAIRTIGDNSTAHLFVATILPQQAPRAGWEKVDIYNASLPAMVAAQQAAGKHKHSAGEPQMMERSVL